MKHIKTNLIFLLPFVSLVFSNRVSAQVSKYEKIEKIGRTSFNYSNEHTNKKKIKKDNNILVVYSDRGDNSGYADSHLQVKGSFQEFLKPYFVIDSKTDAYEVVVADSTLIGKPKGLFSFLMGKNYHFTDTKALNYVGWLPKKHTLKYKSALISEINNKPLKYKIGVDNLKGLNELNKAFEGDSIKVFQDPFFKKKSIKKLALNQTAYVYKYNETGNAVLISNLPTINDTTAQVIGWVPTALISPIGQGHVYNLPQHNRTLITKECDTLHLHSSDIHSDYLYDVSLNKPGTTLNPITKVPLYVWDYKQNVLINVKGNDLLISEGNRLEHESKTMNFHFVFGDQEKHYLKPLINALQNLGLFFAEHKEFNYTFSAICTSNKTSFILPKTTSFAKWLDFIKTIVEDGKEKETLMAQDRLDLGQAITLSMGHTVEDEKNFENNFFIIAGSQDVNILHKQENIIKDMALKSSKLLFVQLQNKALNKYQDNLLLAKETMSKTAAYYNKFIENYIIDNDFLINKSSLKNIHSENSNIYIYDAPKNSLFNGGIVFPGINETIGSKALSIALDSVLSNTIKTNEKLISSLNKYERKLGVLRSKPSSFLKCISKSDSLNINRSHPNDVYYRTAQLNNATINPLEKGYEMTKTELITLIENYRTLVPRFSTPKTSDLNSKTPFNEITSAQDLVKKDELTKRNRRKLNKIYRKQVRGINKAFKRKVIYNNEKLSKLFFYKTGIKVKDDFNNYESFRIKRQKTIKKGFNAFYFDALNKVDALEKAFLDNDLQQLETDVYFIPEKLLL